MRLLLAWSLATAIATVSQSPAPAATAAAPASPLLLLRAQLTAQRLVACSFAAAPGGGPWPAEGPWEAGTTLESLADLSIAVAAGGGGGGADDFEGLAYSVFLSLPPVMELCNDGNLWWALAWVRAAKAVGDRTPNGTAFLERATEIFDHVVEAGVEPFRGVCGGAGVAQCPAPQPPQKNAITTELFIAAAMYLHPYAKRLGRPASYFLGFGAEAWAWFSASGLVNDAGLVNDGLDPASCANDGKTTWTYNQGVLLDGLALLSAAAKDPAIADAAWRIANTTMHALTDGGVLVEPCAPGGCAQDQIVFKGEFARHLARFATLYGPRHRAAAAAVAAFLQANARSLLANAVVENSVQPRPAWHGDYAVDWRGGGGGANPGTIGSASSGVNLLTAAALVGAQPDTSAFRDLGLGNCADAAGDSMPSCFLWTVSEKGCVAAALALDGAVAYDYTWHCDGQLACRVRSLKASSAACAALPHNYPATFQFDAGNATSVTAVTPAPSTICVLLTV